MTERDLISNLHRRMDEQDRMLRDIDRKITGHMAEVNIIRPALEELVTLWKGSKILIPLLLTLGGAVAAAISWGKDHIK